MGASAAVEGGAAAEGAKTAGEVAAGASATGAAAAEGTAAAAGTAEGAGAATAAEGSAAAMPAATAEAGGAAAVESGAAGTSGAAATGSDVLGTIKTLAPAVSAGANLLAAGASVAQAEAAKNMQGKPNATPATPQLPTDPDIAALRKRNALLFGADSPLTTDLTRGTAETGNLGRATLLGGSTKLGG